LLSGGSTHGREECSIEKDRYEVLAMSGGYLTSLGSSPEADDFLQYGAPEDLRTAADDVLLIGGSENPQAVRVAASLRAMAARIEAVRAEFGEWAREYSSLLYAVDMCGSNDSGPEYVIEAMDKVSFPEKAVDLDLLALIAKSPQLLTFRDALRLQAELAKRLDLI
jgi:hypothetical protein